jgi:hypothetical protein
MLFADCGLESKVCDGSCHARQPVGSTGSDHRRCEGAENHPLGARECLSWSILSELNRPLDSRPDHVRSLTGGTTRLFSFDPSDLHYQIDPIEQWPRYPLPISGQNRGTTLTWLATVAVEAARTGVGGSNKMERGGELSCDPSTGDSDKTVLQRLTECVEVASRKFCKLIQKQNSSMGKRRLPRNGHA